MYRLINPAEWRLRLLLVVLIIIYVVALFKLQIVEVRAYYGGPETTLSQTRWCSRAGNSGPLRQTLVSTDLQ